MSFGIVTTIQKYNTNGYGFSHKHSQIFLSPNINKVIYNLYDTHQIVLYLILPLMFIDIPYLLIIICNPLFNPKKFNLLILSIPLSIKCKYCIYPTWHDMDGVYFS